MRLFSSKIRRNLTPSLRIPLINGGCPGVIMQPHLRFPNHKKEVLIGRIPLHFGLASFGAQPCERGDAIGINDPIEIILFDIREPENECQELTDVIRALLERSPMEDLGTGIGNDSSEFHDSGVTAARGIDGQRG